ncbi:NAD-dependent deacetylase [Rhizobiales bacterium]|uniref:SIR2 family NAD-dependent protein deacylase n=1 Tax=Hongsoonwoonella zoysiae TaxID=2821844 RepID=UPI00155F5B17|nr:Sir2 family NAD-dependent protein deacetylase [Hongsoonwoonella zoysiae]NRG18496.1 NAD-dependent deacetylase [Hongsoonwoonella zoysiae]
MAAITNINEASGMLRAHLGRAKRGIGFTGAGISTDSGIPDFRSPGGIWERYRPIEFDEFLTSEEARLEDWRRRFEMIDTIRKAEPNAGHLFLTRRVEEGRFSLVVTQNIDGLHQKAGLSHENLVELHGNGTYATCLDCGCRRELDDLRATVEAGRAPRCVDCGGLIKAAVVSFGQGMPETELARAAEGTESCDFFLVLGSSLQVQPAASLPILAKRAGATLAIVNREATPIDDLADVLIRAPIAEVCESLI